MSACLRWKFLGTETVSRQDERNINETAGLIEKTLAEFGIPATVVGFRVGPTVTQFAVAPGFVEKEKMNSEGDPKAAKSARGADRRPGERPGAGFVRRAPADRSASAWKTLRGHRSTQRPLIDRASAAQSWNPISFTSSGRRWRLPWDGMSPGSRW